MQQLFSRGSAFFEKVVGFRRSALFFHQMDSILLRNDAHETSGASTKNIDFHYGSKKDDDWYDHHNAFQCGFASFHENIAPFRLNGIALHEDAKCEEECD